MKNHVDVGYPMEVFYGDFLHAKLSIANVEYQPGLIRTSCGATAPDYAVTLPHASRKVMVDVTVSALPKNPYTSIPKSDVRNIYLCASEQDDSFGGLVIYQQLLMLTENLYDTLSVIRSLAYSTQTTLEAQSALDLIAKSYHYQLYRSSDQDWEKVAQNLRQALNI